MGAFFESALALWRRGLDISEAQRWLIWQREKEEDRKLLRRPRNARIARSKDETGEAVMVCHALRAP